MDAELESRDRARPDERDRRRLRPISSAAAGDAKGKSTSGSHREAESTDAPERGGLPRSSDEASVMLVERRGQAIAICSGQPVSDQPTTGGTRCRMEDGSLHAVARAG